VNIFLRFSIIVLGILTPFFGVFAASGQEHTGTNTIEGTASGKEQEEIKSIKDVKKDIKTTLKNIEKVREDEDVTDVSEINKAIIQLYKMQGNKVLKELDQSLQKFYDDDETRMQAYKQIQ
jgi:pyrroloquinoline quinone (PQQ) biosynthesis protein C